MKTFLESTKCKHPLEKRTLLYSGFVWCSDCKTQIRLVNPSSIQNIEVLAQALGLREISKQLHSIKNTMCNNTQAPEQTINLFVQQSVTLWSEIEIKAGVKGAIKIQAYKQTCGFMPVYDSEIKLMQDYPEAKFGQFKISYKDYVERIKKK